MNGTPTNLEPFEAALDSLDDNRAAGHTAMSTYVDIIWPVADANGRQANLVWPEYDGEQVKTMIETRKVPGAWQGRIRASARGC